MKKYLLYFLLIVVFFSLPTILWYVEKTQTLEVAIIDKTVPDEQYREHLGINWLLNYEKYVKKSGEKYSLVDDYYGMHVDEVKQTYTIKEPPESYDNADVIYVADTYGVYENDLTWIEDKRQGRGSILISGGMGDDEWTAIQQRLTSEERSTLIVEFNSFASPTDANVQKRMTEDLRIDWDGWTGRYFNELDPASNDEIPEWMIESYKKDYEKEWLFVGKGFVLVNEQTDKLVILTDEHVNGGIHVAFTDSGEKKFGIEKTPQYNYWFDIVSAIDEEDVLATYEWDLTKDGVDLLEENKIPESFAAIIESRKGNSKSYYLAGDYTDVQKVPKLYQYKWLRNIRQALPQTNRAEDSFFWKGYAPIMSVILEESTQPLKTVEKPATAIEGELKYASRVKDDSFEVLVGDEWQQIKIKGVNIGMAKPGTFPGEAAITEEEYSRWLKYIGEMGANSIRVYTIHPPGFYHALKRHNEEHENKIYLFQGIWSDEEPLVETLNAFSEESTETFRTETKRIIDVIHGNATLEPRPGHASGNYSADISPYVIGWIMGIEWYPLMVEGTNEKNAGIGDYKGTYIETEEAEPFEYWLAENLDLLVDYEMQQYNWMRPISFTNWVTTDLLDHPYEPFVEEDLVSVDPNVITVKGPLKAVEQFASYHVYPYYPDFFNYDENYLKFKDFRGKSNSYAAYLKDLHEAHTMPVLIAEFGVPASRGLTHENPYGWNQGFLSETEQGEIVTSLYEDIVQEELLGGLVFTWQDEWFKRTWNTFELDNPDRRPFWSNAQTNEQQFGLLSFDRHKIKLDGELDDWEDAEVLFESKGDSNKLKKVSVDHDERYLYMRLDIDGPLKFDSKTYPVITFNTIEDQGNKEIEGVTFEEGMDFILKLQGEDNSRVQVDAYYDIFRFQYVHELKMLQDNDGEIPKNSGKFNPIEFALNKEITIPVINKTLPFKKYETGVLKHGNSNPESPDFDSLADYYINEESGTVEIRLPWLMLNFTDPSNREIWADLYDEKSGMLEIEGIEIGALLKTEDGETHTSFQNEPNAIIGREDLMLYKWDKWDLPQTEERLKASYYILQEAFK